MLAGLLLGSVDSEVGSAVMLGGMAGGHQAMINFTRENEYEADRVGIDLLSRAQFDPQGMVEFFQIMSELSGDSGGIEYLRTHPLSNSRVAEAIGRVGKLPSGSNQIDDYLLFKDYLYYTSHDHLPERGSDFLRALALVKKARYEEADQRLADLYNVDPENIWYSIAYAENLEYLERTDEAELVYRRLLDIFPGDYVLSMRLLRLLEQESRYQAALLLARQLEVDYPDQQQVYFELSKIYQSLDRPAMKLMAEAEFHRITGNTRQAIRLYDQVLESADADKTTVSKAREKRFALLEQ
jgi:predicted Zn-dependent protease